MRNTLIVLSLLLCGCGMSNEEVIAAKQQCEARGREPIVLMHLWGGLTVRCI